MFPLKAKEYIEIHLLDDEESISKRGSRIWSTTKWVSILFNRGLLPSSYDKRYEYWHKMVKKELDRIKKEHKMLA